MSLRCQGHLCSGHNTYQPSGSPLLSTNTVLVTTKVPFATSARYTAEQAGISCGGVMPVHWFCLLFISLRGCLRWSPRASDGTFSAFPAYALSITETMDPFSTPSPGPPQIHPGRHLPQTPAQLAQGEFFACYPLGNILGFLRTQMPKATGSHAIFSPIRNHEGLGRSRSPCPSRTWPWWQRSCEEPLAVTGTILPFFGLSELLSQPWQVPQGWESIPTPRYVGNRSEL